MIEKSRLIGRIFMTSKVKPIPDGFSGAIPYMCVKDAGSAIEFYKRAFGATESMRIADANGKVGHAEIKIGAATIMLTDEWPEMGFRGPQSLGGSPVRVHLYVEDVDSIARQAIAAGAKELRPVEDQFYGDRSGILEDPFGHVWSIGTHTEDVSPEEIQKRATCLFG